MTSGFFCDRLRWICASQGWHRRRRCGRRGPRLLRSAAPRPASPFPEQRAAFASPTPPPRTARGQPSTQRRGTAVPSNYRFVLALCATDVPGPLTGGCWAGSPLLAGGSRGGFGLWRCMPRLHGIGSRGVAVASQPGARAVVPPRTGEVFQGVATASAGRARRPRCPARRQAPEAQARFFGGKGPVTGRYELERLEQRPPLHAQCDPRTGRSGVPRTPLLRSSARVPAPGLGRGGWPA